MPKRTSRSALTSEWDDAAHIEVRVADANGTVVPTASNPISFALEVLGKIVGVDNGSIVSREPFQAGERKHSKAALCDCSQDGRAGEAGPKREGGRLGPAEVELRPAP